MNTLYEIKLETLDSETGEKDLFKHTCHVKSDEEAVKKTMNKFFKENPDKKARLLEIKNLKMPRIIEIKSSKLPKNN